MVGGRAPLGGQAALLRRARAAGSLLLLRARRAALRAGAGAFLALLLLWLAIFLYASFYCSFVPTHALVRPVHYAFRSDCGSPGPELCSFPTANVSLLGSNREKVLLHGQLYRVALELELPESPLNRELGMFMVAITCYGAGGRPLASAARAAMLHYRSRLLRALDTVAFAALFLAGAAEQKQTLEVELYERYREDSYAPTVGAVLEIRSKRIQLYSARLRIHAHFSGLQYLLHRFPLTCALLGVAGNWALLGGAALGAFLRWGRGSARPRPAPPPQGGRSQRPPRGGQEEEEAPAPSGEEPESLGAGEPREEAAPPLLAAAAPPREEEEEEEGGEGREEGAAPSPAPPLPPDGPAPTRDSA